MQWRDPDGHVVMIDDARFAPIFKSLDSRGVVVLGHQGEPRNAWLPLDQMTINGDRQYFGEHPNYHMALHPEWPTYEQQLAARDRMLDAHPTLQFVGVHLASLEWDVDRVAAFLDRYPNARVDLAARMPHLQRQAVSDRDRVRAFFIKYQDRILYGTDITRGKDQTDAALADEAHAAWLADWKFLAGNSASQSEEFEGTFLGLALPRAVIDKIYGANARRLFPRAWH
jgi:predicted TIM-barrel fold metal-dependent hydrolase